MKRPHIVLAIALGALAFGCAAGVKSNGSPTGGRGGTTGVDAGSDHPTGSGGSQVTGSGGSTVVTGSGGSGDVDMSCTPNVSCTPPGGEYCGTIGNGCPGGSINCGACPGDQVCGGQ